MKTNERSVIVEVTEGGKNQRHIYPIVTKDGNLMTHRLYRLLSGKIGRSSAAPHESPREIHYVGMVWRRPCTILKELEIEQAALMSKLAGLTREPVCIEMKYRANNDSSNDNLSRAIRERLEIRRNLKWQIAEYKRSLAMSGRA